MNCPTWLYRPVTIKNLDTMQREFLDIAATIPNFENRDTDYFRLDHHLVIEKAPVFINFLKKIGLYNRWLTDADTQRNAYTGFVTTNNDKIFPMHKDFRDWKQRTYALNFPLINCEDSYTIWYDSKIELIPPKLNDSKNEAASFWSDDGAIEVGRMPATETAFINLSIPHRPFSYHNKIRSIVTTRFTPEIHDLFDESGNFLRKELLEE